MTDYKYKYKKYKIKYLNLRKNYNFETKKTYINHKRQYAGKKNTFKQNKIKKYYCVINDKYNKILRKNPHTIQYFCSVDDIYKEKSNKTNTKEKLVYSYNIDNLPPYHTKNLLKRPPYKSNKISRKVSAKSNKLKYAGRKQLPATTLHWGQLKLMMTEVDFFNRYLDPKKKYTVIYAGAAKGTHTLLLTEMYTNIKFILVDPSPFDKLLYKKERVTIINDYMTDELSKKLKKKYDNIILISDIRIITQDDLLKVDMDIIRDQDLQRGWYNILDPLYAMFKFRLPWNVKKYPTYKYFDGVIYKQCFAPKTSTETRLIVKQSAGEKNYNVADYEDALFYFNLVDRARYYNHKHDLSGLHMDHCYDCTVTLNMLETYLESDFNINFKNYTVNKLMKKLINVLTEGNNRRNKLKTSYNILSNLK